MNYLTKSERTGNTIRALVRIPFLLTLLPIGFVLGAAWWAVSAGWRRGR